jgi:type I restriction enzyme S subunit
MIADLKPYPEYKESGLPWLGRKPAHWQEFRLDRLFDLRQERPLPEDGRVTGYLSGRVTLRSNVQGQKIKGVVKDGGWIRVHPGDFAISGMNAHLGGMGVSDSLGKCSPIYLILKPKSGTNPHFVSHSLRHVAHVGALKSYVNTIRYNSADFKRDALKLFYISMPSAQEQAMIVIFLNWANGRLERAIRAKQKVIALLNEQKQAIIHRAVTCGLDHTVPLKPSGIPWLGDIPQHWEVRRVKQVTRILRGKFTHRPRNDSSLYDGRYPFIQTGVVARAAKFITAYSQTLNDKGLAVSKMFPSGTLVMTIAANIGEVAVLTFDACFPDSIVGFVPSANIDRDYLYLVFLCMKADLLREAPVNTQGNLNVERIGAMGIPSPSHGEQEEIAKHVEVEISSFVSSISRLEREIVLLREYRTRLAADIVTGKLDVREAAARLPDEAVPDIEEESLDLNDETEIPDEETGS